MWAWVKAKFVLARAGIIAGLAAALALFVWLWTGQRRRAKQLERDVFAAEQQAAANARSAARERDLNSKVNATREEARTQKEQVGDKLTEDLKVLIEEQDRLKAVPNSDLDALVAEGRRRRTERAP